MEKDKILHIKTGGTIGGCVPEYKEIEAVSNIFSDFIDFTKHLKSTFKIQFPYEEMEVCHKDSREITNDDRRNILDVIRGGYDSNNINRFLITHGTYTMPDTANYLLENLPNDIKNNLLIILTGSMYPWAVYGSDAPMNLGASIANLINFDRRGIYICMHGQLFEPKNVVKDIDHLLFKSK